MCSSYISQDSALAENGLIPERVHTVTSMTLGRRKKLETSVDNFTYESLSSNLFSLSLQRCKLSETHAYLIATPEEALVDTVYRQSDLKDEKALEDF